MWQTLISLDYGAFLLSFKLAFITTVILFIICMPLAWYLVMKNPKIRPLLEAFISLSIVLPPSVVGFYMLYFFAPNSSIGIFLNEYFNISMVFSFEALVLASCFYSIPFMFSSLVSGISSVNKNMIYASYLAGKSEFITIFKVVLPNMSSSLLSAIVITFAHTVGEFGIVLMIGGSVPDETKVVSIWIYEFVENMDYQNAHIYSLLMLVFSFLVLFLVYLFDYIQKQKRHKYV